MDVLFDGLDQLMDAARRRFPVGVTLVALTVWGVLAIGASYLLARDRHPMMAATVSAGPVLLLVWSGLRGIGRVPALAWPLGASSLVLIGGLLLPNVRAPSALHQLAFAVISFVYVQVFLCLLVSVDELRRSWVRRRHGGDDQPGMTWRARRRVLQLKLLLATLLVAVLTNLGEPRDYVDRIVDPDGGPPFLLRAAILLVLVLAFVGLFRRSRKSASTVAAALFAAFAVDAYVLDPAARVTLLTQHGWLVASTTYLWAKAARKSYWPSGSEVPEPPNPSHWTPPRQWEEWEYPS